MEFEITFKNYQRFSDSSPARIVVRRGLTAFVGVNDSDKSSLLKFFYEFRELFRILIAHFSSYFLGSKNHVFRRLVPEETMKDAAVITFPQNILCLSRDNLYHAL